MYVCSSECVSMRIKKYSVSDISAYMDFRPGTLLRGAMMCVCLFNEIHLYHRHSFNISPYMDIRPGTLLHDVMMCVCFIIEFM